MLSKHRSKIDDISRLLKDRKPGQRISFHRNAVTHQIPIFRNDRSKKFKVEIGHLNEIIQIDSVEMTCIAEPQVKFCDLVNETLKFGLVPCVVPELMEITIGGAVAGGSVESMSYKMGGFHDTCLEYEIMDYQGRTLKATPDNENKELFQFVHGTFGTLGLITLLKFKLIPAKSYVHVKYEHCKSADEFSANIRKYCDGKEHDFIDGIILSETCYTICKADFVDQAPYTNKYDWMKIYYKTVETLDEDYLETSDYFFRYDAGCHWIARNFGLENPVLRFMLGRLLLPSTNMLSIAQKVSYIQKNTKPPEVVVDLFIPFSKWLGFWKFYQKELDYYPVWVVPYRISNIYPWIDPQHTTGISDDLFMDLAIYGLKQKKRNIYRLLEEEMLRTPGMTKTLISHNYLSRDEFCSIWNYEAITRVKAITDPEGAFGDIFTKMCG